MKHDQISRLVAGLSDPDRFRRATSVQMLVDTGSHAASEWPSVRALRSDPYAGVRLEVVRGTYLLSVPGEDAVPLLSQFLCDDDSLVRNYAKWALECRASGANAEHDGRLLEDQLGWWGPSWNMSRDDPWWRDWLTSRELFTAIHDTVPRVGWQIHALLGGVVFAYDSGHSCSVEVWIAPNEIIVAYPGIEKYSSPSCDQRQLIDFDTWIDHLRHSAAMELGAVRGRSSYGATRIDGSSSLPIIKWAQRGDWASMARNWHFGTLSSLTRQK